MIETKSKEEKTARIDYFTLTDRIIQNGTKKHAWNDKNKRRKKKLNGKVNNRPFLINKILPGNGFLI